VCDERLVVPPQVAGAIVELAAGAERDAPRAAAEVLDAEAGRRDGDVVVALMGEDPQLRREVVLECAMAVEVVGLHVEQHRSLGREVQRVLELEGARLADDHRLRRQRPGEAAHRGADVPGDRDRPARLAVDVAEQLDRRRLAVRARDGDELVGQQAPAQLELAEDRDAALAGGRDDRRLARHAGRLHDRPRMRQEREPVGPHVGLEPVRYVGAARIDGHDPLAARQQRAPGGDPRAREPDDEPGAGGQRRARALRQRTAGTA